MIEIIQTATFKLWLRELRDDRARVKITQRMQRLMLGNAGDTQPVGEGISELRIHHGAGYRVYFVQRGQIVIILLCGGDKATQASDISRAKQLAKDFP